MCSHLLDKAHFHFTMLCLPCLTDDPSAKKLGEFLFMNQAQVSSATSAMFYLGAAQTPVAITLAANAGVKIDNPFGTYVKGSFMPSAVLIVLIPAVVYFLVPPEIKKTPWAPQQARERLSRRGPLSWQEIVMGCTLLSAVALWVSE
jgi:DASS family divalent anion:Na+ symporter